jgi:S-DNA-T family DNA segregation ATPase FtsK/SpoIIIE
VPGNKVTPELASRKSLGLHPIVIGVDECQVWFEHPTYGDEFEEICTDLVKRGPAAGISLILATQRPDAKSLPTGISANAVLRFCLKVMGHTENDMVLGTGTHKAGIRATMLSRRDRGIGFLAGEGDDPTIARTFYLDAPAATQVVTRARALRERAGTLSGHALGHTVDTAAVRRDTLLDDLAAVMAVNESKVWTTVLVERLTGLRPDVYAGLTREQLTAALKPYGVTTGQVWGTDPATGESANRKGITRDHVTAAITKRDGEAGGKPRR